MNILITGAKGFLGKHLTEDYVSKNTVHAPGSQQLDVVNTQAVDEFFNNHEIDIVLHTAIKGGKRTDEESYENLIDNLQMYRNLKRHSNNYRLMINFGSGAEFDRRYSIDMAREEEILQQYPEDFYGLAKNIITRDILKFDNNIINLRLFGCFGPHEAPTRFIRGNILNVLRAQPIEIHKNRLMDFFWVKDLCILIDHLIEQEDIGLKDVNACYEEKKTLMQIGNIIKSLTKGHPPVILKEKGFALSYTGSDSRVANLRLNFNGLEAGIRDTYEEVKLKCRK